MRKIAIRLCITATAFLVVSAFKAPATDDSLESKLLNAINIFYQAYPHEKIHLQFNKSSYAPGEDIWFKSYILPVDEASFSSLSKIMYVELIDMQNNLVKREVLPVDNGVSEGHFKLGPLFNTGIYHVRAYTAWMLNFDPAFFFNRDIPVFNGSIYETNSLVADKNYALHFYPEGGSLVTGLTSVVAYKAEDAEGRPIKVTGKIIDDKGTVKALLHTGDDGLGSFIIHPLEGVVYSASAETTSGITKIFPLPEVKKSGIVLHVVDKPDSGNNSQVYFHIARSKNEKEKYGNIIICAHTAKFNRLINIRFDSTYAGDYDDTILIATSTLGLRNDGQNIAHITVFNKDGEPLADRLVFLHHGAATLAASLRAITTNAAGANQFTLQVPNDSDGHYSVSVTSADSAVAKQQGDDVFSDIYLHGIQNYLYNPANYFEDNSTETRRRLDLVMLTESWNYFDWQKVLANKFPKTNYLPEQSLSLKGNVVIAKGDKKIPFVNNNLVLIMKSAKDSLNTFLNISVNDKGNFYVNDLNFHDTASFYYQNTSQKKNKEVTVTFDKNETDSVLSIPFYYKPYKYSLVNYHSGLGAVAGVAPAPVANADGTTLKGVTVTTKVKTHLDSLDDAYTSGVFAGERNFSRMFDLTDEKTAQADFSSNVLQYLQGRVPGLNISGDLQNTPEIYWRETSGIFKYNKAVDPVRATILNMPIFYIDERQLNSNQLGAGDPKDQLTPTVSQLTSIRVSDIALIKVYEPGTFYGSEGGAQHGAVAIFLKKGIDLNTNQNVNKIVKQGFSFVPAFRNDEYNANDKQAIYWNPDIRTDSQNHTATFNFINNTGAKRIEIVVEGFDRRGKLCRVDKIVDLP